MPGISLAFSYAIQKASLKPENFFYNKAFTSKQERFASLTENCSSCKIIRKLL